MNAVLRMASPTWVSVRTKQSSENMKEESIHTVVFESADDFLGGLEVDRDDDRLDWGGEECGEGRKTEN